MVQVPPGFHDSTGYSALAPAGLELAWFTFTSLNRGERGENQDNLVIVDAAGRTLCLKDERPQPGQRPDWPTGRLRLAVLDGMGGHDDGRAVAEEVAMAVMQLPAYRQRRSLTAALDRLHRRLHETHAGSLRPPGCTLTLIELVDTRRAWLYHVGDSRLYALDAGGHAECQTVDHVLATRAALRGQAGSDVWWREVHARNRSVISQAFVLGNRLGADSIGLEADLYHLSERNLPSFLRGRGDCRSLRLRPGMRYLLASDGLWCVPEPADLVAKHWPRGLTKAATPRDALAGLLNALSDSAACGASDNVTAIMLQTQNS